METQLRRPLRGIGPQIFISYSFVDSAEAQKMFDGFQPRMVDEAVFIGKYLPTVLPQVTGNREAVMLVLTEHSNHSEWARSEFRWAQQHLAAKPGRAVIPVVLDEQDLHPPIRRDWVCRSPARDRSGSGRYRRSRRSRNGMAGAPVRARPAQLRTRRCWLDAAVRRAARHHSRRRRMRR